MSAGDHKQPRFVALATLFVAPAVNQFLCTSDCAAAAGCARRPQQPPQLHRRRREGPQGALVCLEATTNVEDICAKICGRKVVRAESSAARSASRALLNMYVLGLQRAKQRLFRGPGALVATCCKFQAVLTTFFKKFYVLVLTKRSVVGIAFCILGHHQWSAFPHSTHSPVPRRSRRSVTARG